MATYTPVTDVPETVRERLSDDVSYLGDENYRIEYNNQNKGYLYVTVPEDDRDEYKGVAISGAIRAVTQYTRTTFGGMTFPSDGSGDELGPYEVRILFGFTAEP